MIETTQRHPFSKEAAKSTSAQPAGLFGANLLLRGLQKSSAQAPPHKRRNESGVNKAPALSTKEYLNYNHQAICYDEEHCEKGPGCAQRSELEAAARSAAHTWPPRAKNKGVGGRTAEPTRPSQRL